MTDSEKWFHNLTSISFPPESVALIRLGSSFKTEDLDISHFHFLHPLRSSSLFYPPLSFLAKVRHHHTFWHKVAVHTLALLNKADAVLVPADKNIGLVCISRNDYHSLNLNCLKGFNLVLDGIPSPYDFFDNALKQFGIRPVGSSAHSSFPRFYGILKLHKNPIVNRPIVSFLGSVLSRVDKFLLKHLAPLLTVLSTSSSSPWLSSAIAVDGSDTAIARIRSLQIVDGLFCGDVTELYSRLPHDVIVQAVEHALHDAPSHFTPPPEKTVPLLRFFLENLYISYVGEIFKQDIGIPMGASVSPLLANLTLASIESQFPFLRSHAVRYLDDVFCTSSLVFESLGNAYKRIQLSLVNTGKSPPDSSVVFLDGVFCLRDSHIVSDLYVKALKANTYLHWDSANPRSHYRAIIYGFFHRLFMMCPDSPLRQQHHIDVFWTKLQQQGWPLRYIQYHSAAARLKESMRHQLPDDDAAAAVAAAQRQKEEKPKELFPFSALVRPPPTINPRWLVKHLRRPLARLIPLSRFELYSE